MSAGGSFYNDEAEEEIYNKISDISGGRIGTEKVENLIRALSEITKKHAFELADQYYSNMPTNSLPKIYQQNPSVNIILQQPSPTLSALLPIQQQRILPQIVPISPIPQIPPITPYSNASYLPSNYLPQPPSFPISGLSTTTSPHNKRVSDHHKKSQKAKLEDKKHDHKSHRKSESQKKSTKTEHRKKDEKKKGKHPKSKASKEKEGKDSTILKIEPGSQEGGILRYFDQKATQIPDQKAIQIFTNEIGSSFEENYENLIDCIERSCEFVHYQSIKHEEWVIVDFKENQVEITGYSITSSTYDKDCTHLKNWSVDVSKDGMNWTTIDEHSNSPDLNGPSITKTYSVRKSNFVRYARLLNKGEFYNEDGTWELEISHVEFYGKIKMPNKK